MRSIPRAVDAFDMPARQEVGHAKRLDLNGNRLIPLHQCPSRLLRFRRKLTILRANTPTRHRMSTPRLTFLYPAFYRSIQQSERSAQRARARFNALRPAQANNFSTTRHRRIEARPNQRYGTAKEPPPHLATRPNQSTAVEVREGEKPDEKESTQAQEAKEHDADKTKPEADAASKPQETEFSATRESPEDMGEAPVQGPYVPPSNPMDTVLHMPSPAEHAAEDQKWKPPHLQPRPYVHHFDTYTMVGNLEHGGFKHEQSVELMKAMRLILAENLDVARDGLVSKSNVENETYLFRAACSELKTEIQNNRKGEMEKMRAQRTQLQHEMEILNQKMSQSIQGMKDDLKGTFDDRKMNVKMEQRSMESRVCLHSMSPCLDFEANVEFAVDTRDQLQDNRGTQLRCPDRCGGDEMGSHTSCSSRSGHCRRLDSRSPPI